MKGNHWEDEGEPLGRRRQSQILKPYIHYYNTAHCVPTNDVLLKTVCLTFDTNLSIIDKIYVVQHCDVGLVKCNLHRWQGAHMLYEMQYVGVDMRLSIEKCFICVFQRQIIVNSRYRDLACYRNVIEHL